MQADRRIRHDSALESNFIVALMSKIDSNSLD